MKLSSLFSRKPTFVPANNLNDTISVEFIKLDLEFLNYFFFFFFDSLLQDHPDIVGVPIEPQIEQKVGLIWRKGKYTPKSVEAFISFVRDYPLFPEEP